MNRAFSLLSVVLLAAVSLAGDRPAPDRGEAVAHVSVPGMLCDGTCPPTIKAALLDDPGVRDVTVDFAKKLAVLRYDAERTHATDALARLTRLKPYASSTLVSVEAVFESDYAKATASADVKKKGAKAKLRLVLEPRAGHAFNAERTSPDLEIELVSLPAGLKSKEPLVKVKGGLKTARTLELELEVDAKAHAGEVVVGVEVRLEDRQGDTTKARLIALAVPVLVP